MSNMKENAVILTLSFAFSIIEDFVEESNENPSLIYTVYSLHVILYMHGHANIEIYTTAT